MAVVSMFLLVLLLGIVDLGRAITTNISLRDAVQEGAMYAAFTKDVTTAEIDARIRAAVSEPDLSTAAIAVYCETESRELQGGSRVRVDMTYDLDLITPIVGPLLGGTMTLDPMAEADRFFELCPSGALPMPVTP
jgi:Flp pilus assembly protein TadG